MVASRVDAIQAGLMKMTVFDLAPDNVLDTPTADVAEVLASIFVAIKLEPNGDGLGIGADCALALWLDLLLLDRINYFDSLLRCGLALLDTIISRCFSNNTAGAGRDGRYRLRRAFDLDGIRASARGRSSRTLSILYTPCRLAL